MSHITANRATTRNRVPTIQCLVQKHNPEAKKIRVAAIEPDYNSRHHCTRYWMAVIL